MIVPYQAIRSNQMGQPGVV